MKFVSISIIYCRTVSKRNGHIDFELFFKKNLRDFVNFTREFLIFSSCLCRFTRNVPKISVTII